VPCYGVTSSRFELREGEKGEKMRGNPLLEKRCSAHGEHASAGIDLYPKALSLKMHVGATRVGPCTPSGNPARRGIIWLAVVKDDAGIAKVGRPVAAVLSR